MCKIAFTILLLAAPVLAQVPQGWFVFGTFGSAGQKGLFLSHPRTPGQPIAITGLQGDLVETGCASTLYRASDGAILVGERSPQGGSVDLHVIHLDGTSVRLDASFSMGVGGRVGEIPQMGLLPDGRIVVAATDLTAGPLAQYQTTSYGIQGLGIVDTRSGLVTVVPISNGAQIVDVFNALAVEPDGTAAYLGTYVTATQGDIWRVPLPAGGAATLVASVPAGLSNMALDDSGQLWVTALDPAQGLFRVEVSTGTVTAVAVLNGALNGISHDRVTGTFAVVSGSAGMPSRSVFWMEKNGTDHLLSTPGFGTPSGISVHPNPARFGEGTAVGSSYDWALEPNAGGLPELGNSSFSLTARTTGPLPQFSLVLFCARRLDQPLTILGADIWVDLTRLIDSTVLPGTPSATIPLGIPNNPALAGARLCIQTLHMASNGAVGAAPGVQFTVL